MNRLPATIFRLPTLVQTSKPAATAVTLPSKIITRGIAASPALRNAPPAGEKERAELPSDSDRPAEAPKSKDEKILDRAQEGEKNKAPFTEEEEKRKGLDKKEGQ